MSLSTAGPVLIANRGEIAVRIIRACRDLGIETVLVHAEPDRDSLAVRMADRALCIGPAALGTSYLNVEAILAAATGTGAVAIHPGYGFLSENATLARRCEQEGIRFVGPTPSAVELMGDKVTARRLAIDADVPVIPGSTGAVAPNDAGAVAEEIGFPVILKATAGGGGRGMRLVTSSDDLESVLASASAEAQSAFGDGGVYVEKYLANARHIEIQVAADASGRTIHLGERDCTIQRRYQKLVEEAPSPALDPATRGRLAEAAISLCEAVGYLGVGTVEFLYDQDSGDFHFIEMNTRLQVEHPVTEAITRLDLVELQLRIALGEPLPFGQDEVRLEGHAIEYRINAEDPRAGFQPAAGRLERWDVPLGPGVRVDTHCYPGYSVPPFYDSLLAKLIVSGASRRQAIARSRRAMAELRVEGVPTTLLFHQWLLGQQAFIDASTSTSWAERAWGEGNHAV